MKHLLFLLAFVAIFIPGTTYAGLRYETGPHWQWRMIERIYNNLPRRITDTNVIVHVWSTPEFYQENPQCYKKTRCSGEAAYYEPSIHTIYIANFWFADYQTMIHELGHHTEDNVLNDAERHEWQIFWTTQKRAITPYGRRNEKEGFADAFMQTYALHMNNTATREVRRLVGN